VRLISLSLFVSFCLAVSAQNADEQDIYSLDWKRESVLFGASAIFSAIQLPLYRNLDLPTELDFEQLQLQLLYDDTETFEEELYDLNIPEFDLSAISNYNPSASKRSDYILFGSLALPLFLNFSAPGRSEWKNITVMYAETMLLTWSSTNLIKSAVHRWRPLAYNPAVPFEEKEKISSRLSFVSGHTSMVAAASFFSAQVFSDLYPQSNWKYLVWGLAITLPAYTGYLRYQAGKHFPSDVIGGYLLGAGIGMLVPRLHRSSNQRLKFSAAPFGGGGILNASYKF
jgi:membrane-associated phospholipid phosphatase